MSNVDLTDNQGQNHARQQNVTIESGAIGERSTLECPLNQSVDPNPNIDNTTVVPVMISDSDLSSQGDTSRVLISEMSLTKNFEGVSKDSIRDFMGDSKDSMNVEMGDSKESVIDFMGETRTSDNVGVDLDNFINLKIDSEERNLRDQPSVKDNLTWPVERPKTRSITSNTKHSNVITDTNSKKGRFTGSKKGDRNSASTCKTVESTVSSSINCDLCGTWYTEEEINMSSVSIADLEGKFWCCNNCQSRFRSLDVLMGTSEKVERLEKITQGSPLQKIIARGSTYVDPFSES